MKKGIKMIPHARNVSKKQSMIQTFFVAGEKRVNDALTIIIREKTQKTMIIRLNNSDD
jgi:hypothetical protein